MEELLGGHPKRIRDNIGILLAGFRFIENFLKEKYRLHKTRYIGTAEQLGIFLYAIVTDLSIRKLAERFQRSIETINKVYQNGKLRVELWGPLRSFCLLFRKLAFVDVELA
jgi:hypothetical protein